MLTKRIPIFSISFSVRLRYSCMSFAVGSFGTGAAAGRGAFSTSCIHPPTTCARQQHHVIPRHARTCKIKHGYALGWACAKNLQITGKLEHDVLRALGMTHHFLRNVFEFSHENLQRIHRSTYLCMFCALVCVHAYIVGVNVSPEEGVCLETRLSDHSAKGASRHGGGDPAFVCVHLAHLRTCVCV